MAEKEYIEREALLKKAYELQGGSFSTGLIVEQIEKAPAVDVVEVKRGEWVYLGTDGNDIAMFRCNKCGRKQFGISKFCASCGAKMKRVIE